MWADRGQALVELALGLPIFLLAALYAFALLDSTTTQEAVEAGARRGALALAGTNDDAQARGAAAGTSWLRGQQLAMTIVPDDTQRRCGGTPVTITLSAPGHLGFLLPVTRRWTAVQSGVVENPGPQRDACAATP